VGSHDHEVRRQPSGLVDDLRGGVAFQDGAAHGDPGGLRGLQELAQLGEKLFSHARLVHGVGGESVDASTGGST